MYLPWRSCDCAGLFSKHALLKTTGLGTRLSEAPAIANGGANLSWEWSRLPLATFEGTSSNPSN